MTNIIRASLLYSLFLILLSACGNNTVTNNSDNIINDSLKNLEDSLPKAPQPGDTAYVFPNQQAILDYVNNGKFANKYKNGIIPVIAQEVPDYANKLIAQLAKYDKFLIVDKASMHVILYDKFGQKLKSYGIACARYYGTKHKKADNRTPEGFFSVEGIYDSSEWRFTNDWGYTNPAKGVFGPKFIRLKIPITHQIGIHGTSSPRSIGTRSSHGCIRVTNENILELASLVEPGIPVIVLPGPKDREVNRREGYDIPFFPTGAEFAMTEEEKNKPVNPKREEESNSSSNDAKSNSRTDSIYINKEGLESSMESEKMNESNMMQEFDIEPSPILNDSIR